MTRERRRWLANAIGLWMALFFATGLLVMLFTLADKVQQAIPQSESPPALRWK